MLCSTCSEDQKYTKDKMWERAKEQEERNRDGSKNGYEKSKSRAQQEWELRVEDLCLRGKKELRRAEAKMIETQIKMEEKEAAATEQADKNRTWHDSAYLAKSGARARGRYFEG